MRFQVMSDLHLEFLKEEGVGFGEEFLEQIPVKAEILVLAGDIFKPHQAKRVFDYLCARYQIVFYVPGNHDYFGPGFAPVRELFAQLKRDHSNLYIEDILELEGRKIIGRTLWFPKAKYYVEEAFFADFRYIPEFRDYVYKENEQDRKLIEEVISEGDIVVTHHLPSIRSTPERYKRDPLNAFFLCDMERVIGEKKPAIWIHGHTHDSCDYQFIDTRIVCNPLGYPNYLVNKQFNPELVIEV